MMMITLTMIMRTLKTIIYENFTSDVLDDHDGIDDHYEVDG